MCLLRRHMQIEFEARTHNTQVHARRHTDACASAQTYIQRTATHCDALQCTSMHCNALQHMLQHPTTLHCTQIRVCAHTHTHHTYSRFTMRKYCNCMRFPKIAPDIRTHKHTYTHIHTNPRIMHAESSY